MTSFLIAIIKDPVIGLDLLAMLFTVFYLGKLALSDFVTLEGDKEQRYDFQEKNLVSLFNAGSFLSAPKFAVEKKRMLTELRA